MNGFVLSQIQYKKFVTFAPWCSITYESNIVPYLLSAGHLTLRCRNHLYMIIDKFRGKKPYFPIKYYDLWFFHLLLCMGGTLAILKNPLRYIHFDIKNMYIRYDLVHLHMTLGFRSSYQKFRFMSFNIHICINC